MNQIMNQLRQELSDYSAKCGTESGSILEFLWQCYFISNPVDDGKIKEAEAALEPVYKELSLHSSDMLTDMVYKICIAYQRAAFLEGIQLGTRLVEELSE